MQDKKKRSPPKTFLPFVAAAKKNRPFDKRFHALGRERQYAKVAEGNRRDDRARRRKQEQEEALMLRMRENSKVSTAVDVSDGRGEG